MGSCFGVPSDLPTVAADVEIDDNTCCSNMQCHDSCPSSCCVIIINRIVRQNSMK